ncbi:hypothetical protein H8D85_01720 [bacterium]|nr:hypothetical protein [bacterium]
MAIKKTIETEVGDMPEETFRKYGSDVKQAAEDVINTIKSEYAPLYTQLIKDPFASEQDLINNPNINENNLQSIRDYVNTAFDGERYKIFLFPKTMRQGIKAGFTSTSETFSETKGF